VIRRRAEMIMNAEKIVNPVKKFLNTLIIFLLVNFGLVIVIV
jgi:hypothetical protein